MPASMAAWMVAMLSARSAGPYMPDMPMQPRPKAETCGPVLPSVVYFMVVSPMVRQMTRRYGRTLREFALCDNPAAIAWPVRNFVQYLLSGEARFPLL